LDNGTERRGDEDVRAIADREVGVTKAGGVTTVGDGKGHLSV